MVLSENLKRIRAERRLTQEQLAKELGLSRQAICLYELGERTPSLKHACKIANFLNVSLDEIVGRTPVKQELED